MDIIETAIVSSYILLQVGTRRSIDRLIDVFFVDFSEMENFNKCLKKERGCKIRK